MIVEIRDVDFRNKGAQLMLHAIVENVRPHSEVPFFVLNARTGGAEDRARAGIDGKVLWKYRSRYPLAARVYNALPAVLPRAYRRRAGIVALDEVDAVLDASGYAFGDPWGGFKGETAARYLETLSSLGARTVLLPQQFGPFRRDDTGQAFGSILDAADLVYARDRYSFKWAEQVRPGLASLRRAPDFTSTVQGRVPPACEVGEDHVLIIPNSKMVAKTPPETAAAYRTFLAECAGLFRREGVPFAVLLHEDSDGDRQLASQLEAAVGSPLLIIREWDPLVIKGIIAGCRATVGSRYHGLISALSSGIPSVGVGWSHKYRALFEDFGCAEYLVDMGDPLTDSLDKVRTLIDGTAHRTLEPRLTAARQRYADETRMMWDTVNALLAA